MRTNVTRWICERCGYTTETPLSRNGPTGWRTINGAEVHNGGDICKACASSYRDWWSAK